MPLPATAGAADYSVEMSEKNGEVVESATRSPRRNLTPRESSSAMSRCLLGAWEAMVEGRRRTVRVVQRENGGAWLLRRTDMPSSPAPRTNRVLYDII